MAELDEEMMRARRRVCLALDVPTVAEGLALASELSDLVGTVKVGKKLHCRAVNEGVNILKAIDDTGTLAFLDLKLHDTPATVYDAAMECAVPGVYMFNIHVSGGEAMCRKAVEGAYEGAEMNGVERPLVIGVTELTSVDDSDLLTQGIGISYDDLVAKRTELAARWGLDGVVCPASKAGDLERKFGNQLLYVTPGVKWKGRQGAGQKQLYGPGEAVSDCTSSILVIGSAIRKAEDRQATAYEILEEMTANMR